MPWGAALTQGGFQRWRLQCRGVLEAGLHRLSTRERFSFSFGPAQQQPLLWVTRHCTHLNHYHLWLLALLHVEEDWGFRGEDLASCSCSSVAGWWCRYFTYYKLKSFPSSGRQATFLPAFLEYCQATHGHGPKDLIPNIGSNHCFPTLAWWKKQSVVAANLERRASGGKLVWPLVPGFAMLRKPRQFLNTFTLVLAGSDKVYLKIPSFSKS